MIDTKRLRPDWVKPRNTYRIGSTEDPHSYVSRVDDTIRYYEGLAQMHTSWGTHRNGPGQCWICDFFTIIYGLSDAITELMGPVEADEQPVDGVEDGGDTAPTAENSDQQV